MYGYLYPNYNAAYQNYGNNNQAGSSWVWIIIVIFIIFFLFWGFGNNNNNCRNNYN